MKKLLCLCLVPALFWLAGCASSGADFSTTNRVDVDDDSMDGGISATDVRTVASTMCPSILALPEVSMADEAVRVAVSDIKNSTRFFIDKNLFSKRLCVELNRYSQGSLRFISENKSVQTKRAAMTEDRSRKLLQKQLKQVAKAFVESPAVQQSSKPITVAVIPVLNSNLVNLNANSFAAMFRGEIADVANGKVQFLMPGETEGADYWLTGQFYPDSMKQEGIINLANYIEVIDERVKSGDSMYIEEEVSTMVTPFSASASATKSKETELLKMLRDPALRNIPDCDKKLNLMLVKPDTKVAVWEKTIVADKQFTTNLGNAQYILSGEISGMSQNSNGKVSDYLLITMELVDAESNEVIWQDAYEVKRVTKAGVVYR